MRSSIIFFEYLSDDDMSWIEQHSKKVELLEKDIVLDIGVKNQTIFILVKGACSVETSEGQKLEDLSIGAILGEVSFVDRRKTSVRVTAKSNIILARLDQAILNSKLQSDPLFASRFYHGVASVLAFRLRKNLQLTRPKKNEIFSTNSELAGEIELVDLDSTAKAGARLSHLINSFV